LCVIIPPVYKNHVRRAIQQQRSNSISGAQRLFRDAAATS